MPMWRCPHCGTPQAETARCWVCRRPSTSCGTCRHYRRSVAGQLGYCGLDPRRQPLSGDEIRGCWEAWPVAASPEPVLPLTTAPIGSRDGDAPLAFVEVLADGPAVEIGAGMPPGRSDPPSMPTPAEPGWSLWGDLDV